MFWTMLLIFTFLPIVLKLCTEPNQKNDEDYDYEAGYNFITKRFDD